MKTQYDWIGGVPAQTDNTNYDWSGGVPFIRYEHTAAGGQTVSPSGIASAEALGTAKLNLILAATGIASAEAVGTAKLNLTIIASGIASGEAFGTAVIAGPIIATGIASAEAFGTPTVIISVQYIEPSGIASAEALGTAKLNLILAATGIGSAEAFGTATITTGAVAVAPTGIASAEAFGTAKLNLKIVTSAIASAEAFGTPTVTRSAITLYPSGIASQEAFGTAIIAGPIIVISIPSAEAFGTPSIRLALAHPILEATYAYRTKPTNRAQVFGDGVLTEDWDWDEIELVYDQLAQANDINLDDTTEAHQRGQAILRDADLEAIAGHILVPMNCGQDLYDVIAVTSPQAGLSASKFRVLVLNHTWIPSQGKYTLKIGLGAP